MLGWEVGVTLGLAIASLLYTGLTLVLLSECWLAVGSGADETVPGGESEPTFVVLMPAHNEAAGIEATLRRLLPEVETAKQIVVVADNCEDDTAAIARHLGATVIERHDRQRRGKGYALDYGVRSLPHPPPQGVVIIDADCWVSPGSLQSLARQAVQSGQPVQAIYQMETPADPSLRDRVSALAVIVKNRVRPAGLSRLGLPIPLTGTGMAFPWQALQAVPLASGHLVEDMQLGIDLAIAGYRPRLAAGTAVTAQLPPTEAAAKQQRTRWEHGHLQVLRQSLPRLLRQALRQRRLDLLVAALDLAIPPLALWSLIGMGLTGLCAIAAAIAGIRWPLGVQLGADGLLLSTVLLCWFCWGRTVLSATQLLAIPLYIAWKIPLYIRGIFRPEKSWVRTQRSS